MWTERIDSNRTEISGESNFGGRRIRWDQFSLYKRLNLSVEPTERLQSQFDEGGVAGLVAGRARKIDAEFVQAVSK
jgi:hypothetical protein